MLNLPVIRWGKPANSIEQQELVHFATGEPIAKMSLALPGHIGRDMRQSARARAALRAIPAQELIGMMKRAGELYRDGTLAIGDGEQSPDDFVRQQSATTGSPEHMCRANMAKNHFVLDNMGQILDALTRGLDLDILTRGYGRESRGTTVSWQAQTPVLGMVLPSNSPGVHTLWLPVVPLQIGLVIKPGSQEPWTPYRMIAAFTAAGVPAEAMSIYPGAGSDVGAAVVEKCQRTMIFGGQPTIDAYRGDPRVQVHGPGYSKILLGDDVVDDWEQHIDLIADSVYRNSGRGCINASGVWASRHTEAIAQALAERLGPIEALPPTDPEAALAAFTVAGQGPGIAAMIAGDLRAPGARDMTASFGPRLVEQEHCAYLRPWVIHCDSPDHALANKEFMFPFVSVVRCPQEQMLDKVGYTLIATAITDDTAWREQLLAATHIDRLNLGAIPTIQLDWLQPHEGNIVDFLYRQRSFQMAADDQA